MVKKISLFSCLLLLAFSLQGVSETFFENNGDTSQLDHSIASLLESGLRGKVEYKEAENRLSLSWSTEEKKAAFFPPVKRLPRGNAVSYSFSGGRFGDNLVAYFHAKWISLCYGLPLIYEPFPGAEDLLLSDLDRKRKLSDFFQTLKISKKSQITSTPSSTLFIIPYFPECRFERKKEEWDFSFNVDWDDPIFKQEVKRCLTPKKSIPLKELPKDCLTLGVHVRRPSPTDDPANWPLKMPPEEYYVEQIKRVSAMLNGQKLYVYILTDDKNPKKLTERLEKKVNLPELTFDCSTSGPPKGDLDDFFLIPQFDCLILCQSNFSLMASKLGDYKVLITPVHATVRRKHVVVDGVEVSFNGTPS